MPKAEISVIIPTFGRAQATEGAIRSVLAQDVDLEIVVVDDGSPTAFVLEEGDDRVSVLRLDENRGAAAARNAGVAKATADWIAFLDSDDAWIAHSLRARLDAALSSSSNADCTIWAAGFADLWPDGRRNVRVPKESTRLIDFASGCWSCPGSTALLSRAAWERSGGQDTNLRRLEDYDWLLRWAGAGGRLAVHPSIAAEICRGDRATPQTIIAAANYLRRKNANSPEAVRQRIEAYLQLELCAAYLHAGATLSSGMALARSWLLRPRLRVALEPFWRAES